MTLRTIGLAALTLPLLLLGACGGGSDADTVVTPPAANNRVPASATASAQAFSLYVSGLDSHDSAEPLVVDDLVAPTSETEEPTDA